MSATEYVVLVDQQDRATGVAEKITAHQKNLLHRAFSVFIFRDTHQHREILLQQRAAGKYHCPLLWTNTCCSHPRQHEDIISAGKRRLNEELDISCELINIGWFHYNAHFTNGLSENEIDHVLVGQVTNTTTPTPNPQEVQAYQWITLAELQHELLINKANYTPWLPLVLEKVESYWSK